MAEIVDFGLQQHKIKMDSRYFENVLSVVAGDTGRRIEVQLLDTNGMVQNTTGLNLRLNALVAGKVTFTDATLVDATTGKYQLDLSNGMFLVPGDWQFQWQITDSVGKKIHSFAFTGNVGKNISEGGTEATNFYLNLEDLKAMQEDLVNGTIDSSVLETNIAEKLTNLETQYAPKLTEVNAQLAHKANEGEVFLKELGININDFDESTRQTFLEAQGIEVDYVLGKNNVKEFNIDDNAVTSKKLYGNQNLIMKDKFGNFDNTKTSTYAGYAKTVNPDGSITISFTNNGSGVNYLRFAHALDFLAEENHTYLLGADVTLNENSESIDGKTDFYDMFLCNSPTETSGKLSSVSGQTKIDSVINVGERKSVIFTEFIDLNKTSTKPHYIFSTPFPIGVGKIFSITYHNFVIYDMGEKGSINEVSVADALSIFRNYGYGDAIEKVVPITSIKTKELSGFDLVEYNEIKDAINNGNTGDGSVDVICLGDSLTDGSGGEDSSPDGTKTTYPNVFQNLSGLNTINSGVGGDKIWDIFARTGSDPIIVNDITIPTDKSPVILGSTLNTVSGNVFKSNIVENGTGNVVGKINPVTINGVEGNLLKSRTTGNYYFTRTTHGNQMVVNRPTVVTTDLMKNYRNTKNIYVFFVGQNGGYSNSQDWINQIQRAIDYIGCDKYLVIGSKSEVAYSEFESTYTEFRTVFGGKFLNLHRYLLDYGLQDANIPSTEEDILSISKGIIPPSLKKVGDPIHFNHFGYTIIGNVLYNRLKSLYPLHVKQ